MIPLVEALIPEFHGSCFVTVVFWGSDKLGVLVCLFLDTGQLSLAQGFYAMGLVNLLISFSLNVNINKVLYFTTPCFCVAGIYDTFALVRWVVTYMLPL